jgi:hypothetical protein
VRGEERAFLDLYLFPSLAQPFFRSLNRQPSHDRWVSWIAPEGSLVPRTCLFSICTDFYTKISLPSCQLPLIMFPLR